MPVVGPKGMWWKWNTQRHEVAPLRHASSTLVVPTHAQLTQGKSERLLNARSGVRVPHWAHMAN